MCAFVCNCVYVHVCVYIYIYIYIYICVCVCVCDMNECKYICVYLCVFVWVCMFAYIHIYIYIYMSVYECICVDVNINLFRLICHITLFNIRLFNGKSTFILIISSISNNSVYHVYTV